MAHLGLDLNEILGNDILLLLDSTDPDIHQFIKFFKFSWADNGDFISIHYTGTGSTHTNITRTGKRDIKGMLDHGMKSLGRFYKQNVSDHAKQEAINVFLGVENNIVNCFIQ